MVLCCQLTKLLGAASLLTVQQSQPGAFILSFALAPASPEPFRQEPFPGKHEQPMATCDQCWMSGFSGVGWSGRAPSFTVCLAEEVSSVPSKQCL